MADQGARPGQTPNEALWRAMLSEPSSPMHRRRRIFRLLPAAPRCKACNAPFHGPGSLAMRLVGRRPLARPRNAVTYWVERPPSARRSDLRRQF